MEKQTHIVVVPSVGYTHLLPILQFSKLLVQLHPDFHVTCLIPTLGTLPSASKAILETLPSNINHIFLPPINPNDIPQGSTIAVQLQLTMTHSLPSIHDALISLTLKNPSIVALVADPFANEALDFAKEFNLLSYIYFPCAATALCYSFYLPKLHEETSCEYRDLQEPIKAPGCVQLHGHDLFSQAQNKSSQAYKLLLQCFNRFHFVDGILINSFQELEVSPLRALQKEVSGNPPVYPVGPIIQTGTSSSDHHGLEYSECLAWLDKQQPSSVLYVSFGSGGTLSQEQVVELALGLELSKCKFLWVVRAPSSSVNAAYLSDQDDANFLEFLPDGFLARTKQQGMVIPSWAPQIEILSNDSIGGFLSHCGWNSVLESVVHGVPLITWPLFAEQKMNAVLLSEGLKVGLKPRVSESGIVEKEEVVKVVKCLMKGEEGEKLRKRMKDLKEAATNALKIDGFSTKTLSQLTIKWRNLI